MNKIITSIKEKIVIDENGTVTIDIKDTKEKLDSFIKNNAKKANSLILTEKVEPNKSFKVYDKPAVIYLSVYNKDGLAPLIGELFAKVNNGDYIVDNITEKNNISRKDKAENYSVEEHKKNKEKEQEEVDLSRSSGMVAANKSLDSYSEGDERWVL